MRFAAGGIDRAQFEALREKWLAQENERSARGAVSSGGYAGMRWSAAYAAAATTPDDAARALLVRPDAHPLIDPLDGTPFDNEPIGRTYLLAGKLDDAVAVLGKASRSCAVKAIRPVLLDVGFLRPRAGARSERRSPGACGAYQRVLQRWSCNASVAHRGEGARAYLALRCSR